MNTLSLIGGGVAIVAGLIYAVYRLGASREHERIRRWLAERALDRSEAAKDAHGKATQEGREKWL